MERLATVAVGVILTLIGLVMGTYALFVGMLAYADLSVYGHQDQILSAMLSFALIGVLGVFCLVGAFKCFRSAAMGGSS